MFNKLQEVFDGTETPILDIQKVVHWKKNQGIYNFEKLPDTAILTVFEHTKFSYSFSKKKIKGIKGNNYIVKHKNTVLCTGCGYGAPYIVSLCEELRALGVTNFIFIGLAGALTTNLLEGEVLCVDKVFSGSGTSYYYNKNELLELHKTNWSTTITEAIKAKLVTCWSTDAPFRETRSLKNYYTQKGAEIVEMECASIYAFANHYRVKAICLIIVSDHLTDIWNPPSDFNTLAKKEQDIIAKILNK